MSIKNGKPFVPDLNAPRGAKRYPVHYGTRHTYDTYVRDTVYPVRSKKEYCDLNREFFRRAMLRIIEDAEQMQLPLAFGSIIIRKYKVKFAQKYKNGKGEVDYGTSAKYGLKVYYTNNNTMGYQSKFCWLKMRNRVPGLNYYMFRAARDMKSYVGKLLKTQGQDYFEK